MSSRAAAAAAKATRRTFWSRPLVRQVAGAVALASGALYINDHVAQIMWISGPSMAPFFNADYNQTLKGDVVLVDMWAPWRGIHRGSIVTFCVHGVPTESWRTRSPTNPGIMAVKRVIALEGDEVYTKAPYPETSAIVPSGQVWVEGDNEEDRKTMDSNWYGPIPKSLIVGKVAAVVWPWAKVGVVRWDDYQGSPRVRKAITNTEGCYPVVPNERLKGWLDCLQIRLEE